MRTAALTMAVVLSGCSFFTVKRAPKVGAEKCTKSWDAPIIDAAAFAATAIVSTMTAMSWSDCSSYEPCIAPLGFLVAAPATLATAASAGYGAYSVRQCNAAQP